MTRIRIRKEAAGAIIFDASCRKQLFTDADLFASNLTPTTLADTVGSLLGTGEQIDPATIELVENRLSDRSPLSAPIAVYLEIAGRCNLHCPHCYKGTPLKHEVLSLKEIRRLLGELAELGVFELRLTGYEPVINGNFLAIAKSAKAMNFYLVVNTNGAYGPRYIQRLLDVATDEVIVSIDGGEETHDYIRGRGTFKKAVNVLESLRANGRRTRINTVVSRRNLGDMHLIGELAQQLGSYVNFLPLRTGGQPTELKAVEKLRAQDMLSIVEEVRRLREAFPSTQFLTYFDIMEAEPDTYHPYHPLWLCEPCPARKNMYISCTGDTFPCDFLSYLGNLFTGGNVRDRTVAQIWHESTGLRRYWTLPRSPKCNDCSLLHTRCYGGCASETLGTELVYEDPLCFRDLLDTRGYS